MSRRISDQKSVLLERVETIESALKTTIEKADSFFANADAKIMSQGKKNAEQDQDIDRLLAENRQLINEVAFLQRQALEVREYLRKNALYRLFRPFRLSPGDPTDAPALKISPSVPAL